MLHLHRKDLCPLALLLSLAAGPVFAENIDPDNDDSQYAWAENVGWLNAEQDTNADGTPDEGVTVDDFELTGWLWGENIGWISLSCQNTGTCGAVDYGVANDGHGNLSGFAWAENVGWINFAPSTSNLLIDPTTGEFSGYAWGENVGWLNPSCANTGSCGSVDYGIKTGWCSAVSAAPAGIPDLSAVRMGPDVELSWPSMADSSWYEIVRGDISVLSLTGGNYEVATNDCVADNQAAPPLAVSCLPAPVPDDGYWYLVRGVNCKGKGTYDSGGAGQIGTRDVGITISGLDCP